MESITRKIEAAAVLLAFILYASFGWSHPADFHHPEQIGDFVNLKLIPELAERTGIDFVDYVITEGSILDASETPCEKGLGNPYECARFGDWILYFGKGGNGESSPEAGLLFSSSPNDLNIIYLYFSTPEGKFRVRVDVENQQTVPDLVEFANRKAGSGEVSRSIKFVYGRMSNIYEVRGIEIQKASGVALDLKTLEKLRGASAGGGFE